MASKENLFTSFNCTIIEPSLIIVDSMYSICICWRVLLFEEYHMFQFSPDKTSPVLKETRLTRDITYWKL